MKPSRRKFLTGAIGSVAGAGLWTARADDSKPDAPAAGDPALSFKLIPIGTVEKPGKLVRIRIFEPFADGLLGLDGWSHVNVFYWFDQNDVAAKRRILRVHPRGNPDNPLTGVFACRAPFRPNLIALSVAKILSVAGNLVTLDTLDALEGSPILDLKPFIPPDAPTQDVVIPAWAKGKP